jgi:5-methylcytosine-specific restriction enzyme A
MWAVRLPVLPAKQWPQIALAVAAHMRLAGSFVIQNREYLMNDFDDQDQRHGFSIIDNEVIDLNLDPFTLSVYLVLLRHANQEKMALQSIDSIGEQLAGLSMPETSPTPLSRPTVRKALRRLVKLQLIEIYPRFLPDGGRTSNGYMILPVKKQLSAVEPRVQNTERHVRQRRRIKTRERFYGYLIDRDGEHCTSPGCGETSNLTIDHIVPRKLGGTNDPTNLHLLCQKHNSEKGIRSWEWFLRRRQQVQS